MNEMELLGNLVEVLSRMCDLELNFSGRVEILGRSFRGCRAIARGKRERMG